MRRDLNGPAIADATGWGRRFKPWQGRTGAGGVGGDLRGARHAARGGALALACSLFALLLIAGTAGATAPVFVSSFDGSGTPGGSMSSTFVAVSQRSGDIYVIDSAHDAVDVFDASGTYVTQILGSSTTNTTFSFGGEDDIAVDNSGGSTDGNVYVTSENASKMFAFDSTGRELWESSANVSDICGVGVDQSGNPWYGDYNNGVQELNAADGTAVGGAAFNPGTGCHIAFDSAGNVAVVHFGAGVDVYDQTGTLVHADHTGFTNTDVAIDPTTNDVYTVDNTGVTIWDSSGNVVAGTPFGPTNSAKSVAVNPANGKVYITEADRVDIYAPVVNHTVSVTVDGTGSGTVDADSGQIGGCSSGGGTCSDSYSDGSTVNLVATPAGDSNFTGWTGCDNPSGNTCAVSVTSDRSVTATFDAKPRYVLRVAAAGTGSGTVTSTDRAISCGALCQATYLQGDAVLLNATAAPGSTFTGWSGGGCSGTGSCPLTMNADASVTATFAQAAPTAATGDPSGIGQTAATVSGTANPQGVATSCRFEYGTSTSYGSSVPCSPGLGTGTSAVSVSAALSGLTAGTTYHYRIVASNAGGTSNGGDRTFTTTASTPPPRTCQTDATLCVVHVGLASRTALVKSGKALVKLSCTGDAGGTCTGTLKLTVKVKSGRKGKTKTVTVGSARFSIKAGSAKTVSVKLSGTAKRLLGKHSSLAVKATAPRLSKQLTLKAPKPSSKRHK